MLRFVILQHDHPELHWDFMLEADGVLKTWRLPAPPPDEPRFAVAIGDHRLKYLDYEGPVSGERGSVTRWDRGSYRALAAMSDTWIVRLHGERWRGLVLIERDQSQRWTIQFVSEGP